jgi:hypothetical protein
VEVVVDQPKVIHQNKNLQDLKNKVCFKKIKNG